MTDTKFNLGFITLTREVALRKENKKFYDFLNNSLIRYSQCDWGDTCDEDKKANDNAVKNNERILAVYKYDNNITIWIITEWDRSVTTILFPREY